jgi:signal transduction histidine kinase
VAGSEDLMIMAQRILGAKEAQAFFQSEARAQGQAGDFPEPTPQFVQGLERELAASVGAATAHAMVGQIVGGTSVSVQDLLAVADESAQMLEYSSQLEAKSQELSDTAAELRLANEKLTQLSEQKDAFLSQISHELRTPMTSIRSFSEILRDAKDMTAPDKTRYASIIHNETIRLTRLLDDLLDLSVLENGQVTLHTRTSTLNEVLDQAVTTALAGATLPLRIARDPEQESVALTTDLDRLAQVFINLVANAQKYCVAKDPELVISVTQKEGHLCVDFVDNGQGIAPDAQGVVFEKFFRVSGVEADGAGLGLSICREIMMRLGGDIRYLPAQVGAGFRVSLPMAAAEGENAKEPTAVGVI